MDKNRSNKRLAAVIIGVGIILVLIMASFRTTTVKTIQANFKYYEDMVEFKGIYFVSEAIAYEGETNDLKLNYKNGEKVSKGVNIGPGITSPEAGILLYGLDGYENKYSMDNINTITPEDIEKIINKKQEMPGLKIVNNSQWLLCIMVDKEKAGSFKMGNEKSIYIDDKKYSAQIIDKFDSEDGYFLVIRIKDDLKLKSLHRGLEGYIIKSKSYGVSVPSKAVVNVNGEEGVFVKDSGYARFKKVNIFIKDKETVVITPPSTSKGNITEYDQIIVNPSGIKDGEKVR